MFIQRISYFYFFLFLFYYWPLVNNDLKNFPLIIFANLKKDSTIFFKNLNNYTEFEIVILWVILHIILHLLYYRIFFISSMFPICNASWIFCIWCQFFCKKTYLFRNYCNFFISKIKKNGINFMHLTYK